MIRTGSPFSTAKQAFDAGPGKASTLPRSLVPVDGQIRADLPLRDREGEPLGEYYLWQLIHALIESGLYPRDCIGALVSLPRRSKGMASLRLGAAIFDDPSWILRYPADSEWLEAHLLSV